MESSIQSLELNSSVSPKISKNECNYKDQNLKEDILAQ